MLVNYCRIRPIYCTSLPSVYYSSFIHSFIYCFVFVIRCGVESTKMGPKQRGGDEGVGLCEPGGLPSGGIQPKAQNHVWHERGIEGRDARVHGNYQ